MEESTHFKDMLNERGIERQWVDRAIRDPDRTEDHIDEVRMRIKVDKTSDALYFRLDESRIVESEEVRPGVILDFDENDRVVGVEFLRISTRATAEELTSLQFQTM